MHKTFTTGERRGEKKEKQMMMRLYAGATFMSYKVANHVQWSSSNLLSIEVVVVQWAVHRFNRLQLVRRTSINHRCTLIISARSANYHSLAGLDAY